MIFKFEPVLLSRTTAGSLGVTTRYRYALSSGVRASGVL